MQAIFLYPLAFIGLAAVPGLVAIYLLRNRFRRHTVSSLMLWVDAREARGGGLRLRRLQTPLLFLLELLVILLLILSASDPQMRLTQGTRPLVVVLDDSFSMLAGGNDSPRHLAIEALAAELRRQMPYSVRFVLAGERPQLLGEPVHTIQEALDLASRWRCHAPTAHLDRAMSLGAELGGDLALILVLTDQPPPKGTVAETGRVQWWAFGSPRPNVAIVSAARTNRDGADRCLLEVANLADVKNRTTLDIEPLAGGMALHRAELELEPGETGRLVVQFPEDTPTVRAHIDPDALTLDDAVILEPAAARPVRVDVRGIDRRTREPLERALRSARQARTTDARHPPHLLFSDKEETDATDNTWLVQLLAEKDATAYAGPFVLDRAHPLTEGLALRGVVWGAGKEPTLEGAPVIMAGNVPLVADTETPLSGGGARHDLRIRFRPDLSTLQDSPDWPILIWNIINWRAAALPGLSRSNIRLGEQVVLNLPTYRDSVQLTPPDQKMRLLPVKGRRVALEADEVGLYEVRGDDTTYRFAVNALDAAESDLRACQQGRWGNWLDETSLRLEYRPLSWLLLLLLLGLASLHLLQIQASRGRD